jgi:hypothetical protein
MKLQFSIDAAAGFAMRAGFRSCQRRGRQHPQAALPAASSISLQGATGLSCQAVPHPDGAGWFERHLI